ncbi:hypothetical protein B0H14DRAFT_3156247 [Mycena olivaceomarginata]|nr:hypothetical protein B0H14DRAFT_3156247 [Mycena olivaceomarginata]
MELHKNPVPVHWKPQNGRLRILVCVLRVRSAFWARKDKLENKWCRQNGISRPDIPKMVTVTCWPPHLQFGSISFNYPAPWCGRHLHSRVESFQSMPFPSPAPVDEGWQVVSPEWWRIPLNAVSWAYSPTPQLVAATEHDEDLAEGDDGGLNADLVGFKLAEAAIDSYEIDVGFHWPPQQIEEKSRPDLAAAVDEHHVALAKERWDELVQDLTGGLSILNTDRYHDSDSDDSLRGLHRSTSTLSSIDLTDSERSVFSVSMPATPRAHRSYPGTMVKTTSPSRSTSSRDSDRSPRRLNAAASSFVPSPAKAKKASDRAPFLAAPENVLFRRSTWLARRPRRSIRILSSRRSISPRDAQGFYSEVESTTTAPAPTHARTPSGLLPAFLHDAFARRRPTASKTRAMVDRLKSSGSSVAQGPAKSPSAPPQLELSALSKPRLSVSEYGSDGESPTLDGDSEGWIGGEDAAAKAATANSKSRRTRDLFLALTRRRSNSSPPKPTLIVEPPADDVIGIAVELPSPTSSSSNDGWIEGPALLLPESVKTKPAVVQPPERKLTPALEVKATGAPPAVSARIRRRLSALPLPPGAAAFYARPPPPYYYPHAHPHAHAHPPVPVPYAAAAYMHQMQVLQMQQQQQQMHMRRVSAPVIPIPVQGRTPRGSISSTSVGSGEWYNPYPTAYPVTALHPAPVFVPRG